MKDDQNAIKNIHITIWLINIITPYKLTEQSHIPSAKLLTSIFFSSKFYVVFSHTQAINKYLLGFTYTKTSSTEQLKSVSEILVKFNLLLIIPCQIPSQRHSRYHSFHYCAIAGLCKKKEEKYIVIIFDYEFFFGLEEDDFEFRAFKTAPCLLLFFLQP